MKKIIVILLAMLGLSASAQIQDTIYNRIPHCWYTSWHDECDKYFTTPEPVHGGDSMENFQMLPLTTDFPTIYAKTLFTEEPIAVNGVALMVIPKYSEACGPAYYLDSLHEPEFAMIYQGYDTDSMALLDSVRWDTLTPSVLKIPLMRDTAQFGFAYSYVYQARFNSPVIVDSTFYLVGTQWTNRTVGGDYQHYPFAYAYMSYRFGDPFECDNNETLLLAYAGSNPQFYHFSYHILCYGMFIPMVDFAMLNVEQDGDSLMGSVTPSGSHSIHTDQVIQAMPGPGYAFSHWNDGDTSNPRVIHLMQDTLFTAYFIVDTVSRDTTGADTTGTTAIRLPAAQAPAFTLAPNPADGAVTVTVEGTGLAAATITVTDLAGKQMLHQAVAGPQFTIPDAQLVPGIYFVTLATPQGTSTQKLVVTD